MTLYLIREGKDSFSWHAFLTTIGYQLLMAEAIMVFYSPNSWSHFHSHKTKKNLHLVLQLIATAFIVTGNVIISWIRTTPHFRTVHAITGTKNDKLIPLKVFIEKCILGLISMVFLALSLLQGTWTYFAYELRSYVKPSISKFLHNLSSTLCFVIGMVSLIYGYRYGTTHDLFESVAVEIFFIAIAIVTTILTLIGAAKSEFKFLRKVYVKSFQ